MSVLHHLAKGIHPAAFVSATPPTLPSDIQDHVLWIDTSAITPPFSLKMWDITSATWQEVGVVFTGTLAGDCLTFPHTATICNPSTDQVAINTPTGTFGFDTTGLTLPGGSRLETYTP